MTYATFIQHSSKWALINENSSFQKAQAHFTSEPIYHFVVNNWLLKAGYM